MSLNPKVRTGPHRPSSLFNYGKSSYFYEDVIWGIYVGEGCVSGLDPLEWASIHAHAHYDKYDEWSGWVCIADPRKVITKGGRPTHLVLHEVGHLITGTRHHGTQWARVVTSLGATSEVKKYYRVRDKPTILVNVGEKESY